MPLFFQFVHNGGRTNLEYPGDVTHAAAIEAHVNDLRFDRRAATGLGAIEEKRLMRTGGVVASVALFAGVGLPAFGDLLALTIGASNGNEYHVIPP